MGGPFRGARAVYQQLRTLPPLFWVLAGMAAFGLVAVAASTLRLLEFGTNAYDLGLYQQALWSGSHGGPFYEAPDFELHGFGSLLQVHPSYLLYLLAPVYGAWPNPESLFVVQAAVVALAAYPLYLLGRDVPGGSPGRGAVVSLLYLAWAPLLGATLYDFHIESFVPLLLFALAWLWQSRRYLIGGLVAVAATLSGEFAGPFVFGLGLFFVIRDLPLGGGAESSGKAPFSSWIRLSATRAAIALTCLAAGGFVVLAALRLEVFPSIYGIAPMGSGGGLSGLTGGAAWFGSSPDSVGIGFWTKLTAWGASYLLVAGVPFWAPRSQVTALPWLLFTLSVPSTNFVEFGFQYGFLLAVPIFLGTAYGFPAASAGFRRLLADPVPTGRSPEDTGNRRGGSWRRRGLGTSTLLLLLVANLVASPIDPLLHSSAGVGPGYAWSYTIPPGYGAVTEMLSQVPAGAPVVTTDDLLPVLANDPQAFVLSASVGPYYRYLPFSSANLPPYVLFDERRIGDVPTYISAQLYNHSVYSLLGVAWSTPAGPVVLFGPAAPGPFQYYGSPPPIPQRFGPGALRLGMDGQLVPPLPNGTPGYVTSIPGTLGNVWYGPYTALPPGAYWGVALVRAVPWGLGTPQLPAAQLLDLRITAFGESELPHVVLNWSTLTPGTWQSVIVAFNLTEPAFHVELAGDQISVSVELEVRQIAFTPALPP